VRIDNNHSTVSACGRMSGGGCNGNSKTAGNFNSILQEQISKVTSSESDAKANPAVNFNLTGRVLDWSEVEARGYYDGFANDPELRAYGRQLALENGFSDKVPGNTNGLEKQDEFMERFCKAENFLYMLSQLIDKGLILRQDIIDSVEHPPKTYTHGDGSVGYYDNMNDFGKHMKGMELTTDLALFEMLWGAERDAKAN
jgi:hypothetical protein